MHAIVVDSNDSCEYILVNLAFQFHAEICGGTSLSANDLSYFLGDANPVEYETYLKTRPATLELNAVDLIARIAVKYEK